MMKREKRVPRRRFREFAAAGGWTEALLGSEVDEIIAGGDVDNSLLVEVGGSLTLSSQS